MPNPRDRATIIDICTDEWVNQDFEHSLLQLAEDLSNLTPVRCDMLLALAPTSPKVESNENKEAKEEATEEEAVTSSQADGNEVQESKLIGETNKRTVDNTSFSASTSKVDESKKSKKKPKRVETETESATLPKEETSDLPQDEVPLKAESESRISREQSEGSTADASLLQATSETTAAQKTVEPTSSGTFKRPGRLSIPKIWDSQENVISSPEEVGKERKAPFIPVGLTVSEAKKVIERRCSVDSGSQLALKRRDSMSSASGNKVRELKKYTGRSLSLNLQEASKTKREAVNQMVKKDAVVSSNAACTKKEESESPYQSKPSTPISEEDKSLAKQIIKKNIARAKLMEKQQVSVSSDSEIPTTPLVSIENSNVSIIQNTPKDAVSKTSGHGDLIQSEGAFNPSPITRSYKKVTFTKDGACIKESGKFYTHEGKDGYTTRVEKKSMVTHIINDGGNTNNVNIQRSDSGSSTDIFDDIFDDHWTGDVFSNVKSLFNNIFERKSIRKSAFDDDNLSTSSSNWASMSKFSSSFKSSFDKRFNDLMSPLSTRREPSKITYPSFSKFGSRYSRESSLHRENDSLRESGLGGGADEQNRQDSTRRRVEQWLNSDDGKPGNLETYGTIGPKNFRRYVRTMTSNDSASNIFKRVQVSNASEVGQVVREKSAATVENCESVNSNAVPRDNEIEVRFTLDNLEAGGPKVLTKKGPVRVSSEHSEVSTADSGIKIAETSSLLEQLRTFGYKNLVSRRLSESSSTEDIQSACQESSSDVNLESSGKYSCKFSAI